MTLPKNKDLIKQTLEVFYPHWISLNELSEHTGIRKDNFPKYLALGKYNNPKYVNKIKIEESFIWYKRDNLPSSRKAIQKKMIRILK